MAASQQNALENHMAIVLDNKKPYVICLLSSNLKDSAASAETIKSISADVYQYMTTKTQTQDTPS